MTAEQVKSRIDFAKLMKDKIFDPSELISVEDIRKEVNKEKKILGPRTIEFYARYGLLKKSIRITGDKKAYYNKDYIFDALALILILKAHYGMSLLFIKKLMGTIKHNPKNVLTDLIQLEEEVKEEAKKCKLFTPEIDTWVIGAKYISNMLDNKKSNMLELIDLRRSCIIEHNDLDKEFKDKEKGGEYKKRSSVITKKWVEL